MDGGERDGWWRDGWMVEREMEGWMAGREMDGWMVERDRGMAGGQNTFQRSLSDLQIGLHN